MKTKRIFLFCSFLWILYNPIKLKAQALKYTITYDTKTKLYARCAKGEEKLVTDFDRLNMRTVTESNSHQIKVFDNNDVETTITHIKSDKFPSWVTAVAKTVIDKKGIKSYDKDGKVLSNIPHSPKSLDIYNKLKQLRINREGNSYPLFQQLSATEEANIKSKGVKVKKVNNSITHMKNKDREFLYDPDRKMIEERLFEGKDLKFSKQQRFQTDLSGKTYPIYSKEISMIKNNKGRRFWHFKEDNTTNYRFTVAVQARENSNYVKESNDKFKFYPNPANKELWVQIPVSMKDKMPILNIKDLLGRVVLNKNLNNSLQSFDVQNLTSGTYILEITTINGEKLIDRFVKQ